MRPGQYNYDATVVENGSKQKNVLDMSKETTMAEFLYKTMGNAREMGLDEEEKLQTAGRFSIRSLNSEIVIVEQFEQPLKVSLILRFINFSPIWRNLLTSIK